MKVLNRKDKKIYESFMKRIKFIKLDCWKQETPDDFENYTPLKEFIDKDLTDPETKEELK